ncbi:hypothetical protein PIB30_094142 [Stylosanthes scabra]|uniref:Secreted protein n=1 Tax=Stylosanthes scabra TaxID=79078 RepID=A0ABU6XUN2_9FABA|nr:hypothetical protein [Stylosanthes scabra]
MAQLLVLFMVAVTIESCRFSLIKNMDWCPVLVLVAPAPSLSVVVQLETMIHIFYPRVLFLRLESPCRAPDEEYVRKVGMTFHVQKLMISTRSRLNELDLLLK